jgi:hypothetical protein
LAIDRARRASLAWRAALAATVLVALLHCPDVAVAQAGPPFLTNDPGTPGNANWEINLGSMQTVARATSAYQVPQIDLNFGVGDRVQLTYEIPYVFQEYSGQPGQTGWGNAYPGIKWRFLDQGEDGLQMSFFPQAEMSGTDHARQVGIAADGPRYLLPVEMSRKVGILDLDVEVGYYLPGNGPKERIMGLVAGRTVNERLELDAEIYDDHAFGAPLHTTTLDIGGRYNLSRSFIALFMAGRSVNGFADGRPEFIGYVGIQILLGNYGRSLKAAPSK